MPVTKSAKRALRGSVVKKSINKAIIGRLEVAVRAAKRGKSEAQVLAAISLADKAAKKRVIHRNKAARIKSQLARILEKKSQGQKIQKVRKAVSRKKK